MIIEKRFLTSILILLLCKATAVFGQFDSLGINGEWFDGKLVTNDGTELRGFIMHNDKLGLFKFKREKNTRDSDIKTYQEKSLNALEYFDPSINDYRKFYSLNCKVDEVGFKGNLLFEALHEFHDKAILRRRTPVFLAAKDNEGLEGFSKNKGHITAQKEGLFCVGEGGELELFFVTVWAEYDGVLRDKAKNKSRVDKAILKKCFPDYWEGLTSYARSNGLDFSDKDDILKILAYCKSLEKG